MIQLKSAAKQRDVPVCSARGFRDTYMCLFQNVECLKKIGTPRTQEDYAKTLARMSADQQSLWHDWVKNVVVRTCSMIFLSCGDSSSVGWSCPFSPSSLPPWATNSPGHVDMHPLISFRVSVHSRFHLRRQDDLLIQHC